MRLFCLVFCLLVRATAVPKFCLVSTLFMPLKIKTMLLFGIGRAERRKQAGPNKASSFFFGGPKIKTLAREAAVGDYFCLFVFVALLDGHVSSRRLAVVGFAWPQGWRHEGRLHPARAPAAALQELGSRRRQQDSGLGGSVGSGQSVASPGNAMWTQASTGKPYSGSPS